MSHELVCLLRLLSVPGIGHQKIRHLVKRFGSVKSAVNAGEVALVQSGIVNRQAAQQIKSAETGRYAETQLRRAERMGVRIITLWNAHYPELLKKIHDPPVLLYLQGSGRFFGSRSIAVVGTRNPTEYGRRMAAKISAELTGSGLQIVSGFARGIDTCAHRSVIERDGSTIAVLGCGVDIEYPAANKSLREKILEKGLLVSEFPLGAEPAPVHFPRRNRIISGLTSGTVVIEAAERSGALITAYNALEQGREVFALPGQVGFSNSRGPHRLIKEGAKLIEGAADIFEELPFLEIGMLSPGPRASASPLSGFEKQIWDLLENEPKHIDRITSELGRKTPEVLAQLLTMELKNCVRQMNGMRFMRQ